MTKHDNASLGTSFPQIAIPYEYQSLLVRLHDTSAYDNVWSPDIFWSFLARVGSINVCPVTMSERKRAAEEMKMSAFIASDEMGVATNEDKL